jgi:hypothetical protein
MPPISVLWAALRSQVIADGTSSTFLLVDLLVLYPSPLHISLDGVILVSLTWKPPCPNLVQWPLPAPFLGLRAWESLSYSFGTPGGPLSNIV